MALDNADGGRMQTVVGGGAASAHWRRILADVTSRPVRAVDGTDRTLLGAAIAGATALCQDHGIATLIDQGEGVTAPDLSSAEACAEQRPVHRRLYETVESATR